eukprot:SAG31_NODE_11893_length_988_cov_0.849269_1_plen_110_part_10
MTNTSVVWPTQVGTIHVPRKLRDLTKQLPSPRYESDLTSRSSSTVNAPPWNAGKAEARKQQQQQQQANAANQLPAIGEMPGSGNGAPEVELPGSSRMPPTAAAAVRSGGQ